MPKLVLSDFTENLGLIFGEMFSPILKK